MRTLLGFKADKSFPQIVYIDGLENGAEFYLQKKNIWTNGALRQEVSNSLLVIVFYLLTQTFIRNMLILT